MARIAGINIPMNKHVVIGLDVYKRQGVQEDVVDILLNLKEMCIRDRRQG